MAVAEGVLVMRHHQAAAVRSTAAVEGLVEPLLRERLPLAGSGELTLPPQVRAMGPMVRLASLVLAMVVLVEVVLMTVPEVSAEHHLEAAVEVQPEVLSRIQMGVTEAKARCEYGPGNSEQRRTQRPGCAEA
tara:strand:+ start:282 stop:677 length:396 start_codon:yes stop_codon:yes gene_type:complete